MSSQQAAPFAPDDRWMATQTILATPELNAVGVYGNYIQAAVASCIGWHLDAVPHFGAFRNWEAALRLWGHGEGLVVDRPSPRGYPHVVVGQNRKVVWDPHPSRAGLDRIDGIIRVYRPTPPGRRR